MRREIRPERPEEMEQLGPRTRLISELSQLESRGREVWILVVFAASVLLLGFLSLFVPQHIWTGNELTVSFTIPPQVLFVVMILLVIFALFLVRRELDLRKMRLTNVSQLLEAQSKLTSSMLDSVTHVFNRSLLRELLQSEISSADRNSRPLTLIMTDIDNFKGVNDRFGHLTGDFVLAEVASILRSCVRGSDYIIRYGGDEFLLVLPETDLGGAAIVKQRIYQQLDDWHQNNRVGDIKVSLSLGIHLHRKGDSADQTLAGADSNMYGDKRPSSIPSPVPPSS
ncbi:MAG: GGDEF domain-containing protein [Acidobacteriota bacterium]